MRAEHFKEVGKEKLLAFAARILVWGGLLFAIYILRSFSLLMFLTFVFAYIQARGVEKLSTKVANRTARVFVVASVILGVIVAIGLYITPRVSEEGRLFVDKLPQYLRASDHQLAVLGAANPLLQNILPEGDSASADSAEHQIGHLKSSTTITLLQQIFGKADGEHEGLRELVLTIRNIGTALLGVGSAFLLSLLFSFLIVLDLPNLTITAKSLRETRLRYIYDEVADNLVTFARVVGQALEAQLYIAILNTVLTAIGTYMLGIADKVAFISVIVFVCSFIPVAGVFISSVPICLIALQTGGFQLMMFAVLLITVIHMIEAYILNPKIYGHHLRMNPVLVLIILTIGGKLFGFWGLVLGVPVMTYVFGYAIQNDPELSSEGQKVG